MPATKQKKGVAVQYAEALLELANERQQAEEVAHDLDGLVETIQANPTFGIFLSNPEIGDSERQQLLERVFKGQLTPLVMNLLGVLNKKGKLRIVNSIAQAYSDLLSEQLGKVEVDVTVAQRFDSAAIEEIRQQISTALKRDAVVHQYVDESIIGGLVVRVGDKVLDASVRAQLEAMRNRMKMAMPRSVPQI